MTEKRRRKTGCLTCRSRRVKCDERKPECERCEIANVECSGYAEKRRVKTRADRPERNSSTTEALNSSAPLPPTLCHQQYPQSRFREDGLPLVALPVNPSPFQRPHQRARDMLGYHQYLYRTLDVLFAPKSFHFWREYLCEAAWETEWVFDAIVALGSIHRAALLLSGKGSSDRDRGFDTKIVAIQTYIRALEGVSRDISEKSRATPLAVGVLILMAYIECFSGNIPAAIRHTQVSQYYSYSMVPHDGHSASQSVLPIESSLRDLELICRIVRPFPSPLEPRSLSNAEKLTVNLPSSFFDLVASSPSVMIQQLLEFTSADLDLKHLVWCLYAAHYQTVSKEKVLAFLQALEDWKTYNSTNFETLKAEDSPSDSNEFSYGTLEDLPFPPLPNEQATSWETCLSLALYNFYKGRLLWALCLLGDPDRKIELDAYFHVYELLRYTRTALTISHKSPSNPMIPCENLRIGFSPLLYLAGRCCPSPRWISWIIQELENVGQEGLFHNEPFATTLGILLSLEKSRGEVSSSKSSSDVLNFLPPSSRMIAVFIPDIDGRSFESFYSRPSTTSSDTGIRFNISKVARWSHTSGNLVPAVEDFEDYDQVFSQEWLLERPIVQKWLDWSCAKEFDFEQVINDHIIGNRLLLEME